MVSPSMSKPVPIAPCLWFDGQAEEAARFYVSIFPGSRITAGSTYPDAGQEIHGQAEGSAMMVTFELGGQPFSALNGGPEFTFTEAISLMVTCETQEEIDYFWDRLGAGGDPAAQQCGWLKDRFGVSWQIVPAALGRLAAGSGPGGGARVMSALLQMKKLVIADLERAAAE
jgi:predicted 3-demethylubiquinone-9 3-methyltransferase (glyoxalase superfamily)